MKTVLIPKTYVPSGLHADKLAILAETLLHLTASDEKRWNEGHWIPFGRRQWIRLFGTRYGPVKRAATATGLIDENSKYSTGRFAKSLRLTYEHRHGETKEYAPLKRSRRRGRVRIDEESLGDLGLWLASHFDSVGFQPSAESMQCLSNHWVRFTFETIRRKEWRAKRDDFGRFHSNFTNLKKDLRKRLTIDKQLLWNSDISSCQPLILAIITYNGHRHARNGQRPGSTGSAICVVKRDLKPDVQQWLELCATGHLYSFIRDRFQSRECESTAVFLPRKVYPPELTIPEVKHEVMRTMFASIASTQRNPVFCVMLRHFPTIAEHILLRKHDNYRQLAWDCQSLESQLVIDGACGELMRHHPDQPIITVHDEIIYREEHSRAVETALKEQFSRVGVDVNVKSEGKPAHVPAPGTTLPPIDLNTTVPP